MRKLFFLLVSVFLLGFSACNKQALEDLQARLDLLERTTIVSIQSQIAAARSSVSSLEDAQRQLREYISALEAKDASLSDIVAALQRKDEQFSKDLAALKTFVNQNAADMKQWMEQADVALAKITALESEMAGIREYLDSVSSRLGGLEDKTQKLDASLQKCQTEIQELRQEMKALQDDMASVKEQLEALVTSVQSVVAVPDHPDGSVEIGNVPDNLFHFEVYPLSAAKILAQLGASAVSLDAVQTKAGDVQTLNLPVRATAFDGEFFLVTVDGTQLPKAVKQGDVALNARLRISDGVVTRSSEYFRLSVSIDPSLEDLVYTAKAVDLGLSVKWSAFNLGADTPEGYGAFFAWGETEPKRVYRWETYKWAEGEENTLNKYCTEEHFGTPDGKSGLDLEDDAAHAKLGGTWRMPTKEEMRELMNGCKWTWVKDYEKTGVSGFLVSSLQEGFEDSSIFLPTAGYSGNVRPQYAGSVGDYWTSSQNNSLFVFTLNFDFFGWNEGGGYRFHGHSIRPVTE